MSSYTQTMRLNGMTWVWVGGCMCVDHTKQLAIMHQPKSSAGMVASDITHSPDGQGEHEECVCETVYVQSTRY